MGGDPDGAADSSDAATLDAPAPDAATPLNDAPIVDAPIPDARTIDASAPGDVPPDAQPADTAPATPDTASQPDVALPSLLGASTNAHAFGLVAVGSASPSFDWTITNRGQASTGALTLTNASNLVTAVNGCPNVLAGNASCTVTFTMTPMAGGNHSASVTLAGAPGVSLRIDLTVIGGYTVIVQKNGGGNATLTSTPAGIDCGASCAGLFAGGSTVAMEAAPSNGSNTTFTGWTGAGCGSARACSFVVNADTALTAAFAPLNHNLVFVSSKAYTAVLGGVGPYDAACNTLATAAGINNTAGDAFVAWVSTTASNAVTRLGTARGWVRLDGKPVADQLSELVTNHVMFHPIARDEFGRSFTFPPQVLIGTYDNGTTSTGYNCNDFTGGGNVAAGSPSYGSSFWSWAYINGCSNQSEFALYCFMKTRTAALVPQIHPGKRLFLSTNTFTPGAGIDGANSFCDGEKPAGVTKARALLSTTTQPASAALTLAATYVRPDGQILGTGQQIASNARLETGPWQKSDGRHFGDEWVFTGSNSAGTTGTAASTCDNWTTTSSPDGMVGISAGVDDYWNLGVPKGCTTPRRLYCVEE